MIAPIWTPSSMRISFSRPPQPIRPFERPTGQQRQSGVAMSADIISGFLAVMRERGLERAEAIIADGQLHRVRWRHDKAGTRNGAYLLHLNGHPASFAECFKRGIRFTWNPKGPCFDAVERKALAQMAALPKRAQLEPRKHHNLAAKQAQAILAPGHRALPDRAARQPYGCVLHGARLGPGSATP